MGILLPAISLIISLLFVYYRQLLSVIVHFVRHLGIYARGCRAGEEPAVQMRYRNERKKDNERCLTNRKGKRKGTHYECFVIFGDASLSLVTSGYLPMQKLEKMEVRRSSVVTEPMTEERAWVAARRSWAIRSLYQPSESPLMTACRALAASVSA